MNGEERKFLETEFIKLKTQFKERWMAHEKRSNDFREILKNTFLGIDKKIEALCNFSKEITNRIIKLPCSLTKQEIDTIREELKIMRENDIRHLNIKINALLFTVLGSVFVTIIFLGIRVLYNLNITYLIK